MNFYEDSIKVLYKLGLLRLYLDIMQVLISVVNSKTIEDLVDL